MADDYKAQLLATEAKLAKDPDNEALLTLKSNLIEYIELLGEDEEEQEQEKLKKQQSTSTSGKNHMRSLSHQPSGSSTYTRENFRKSARQDDHNGEDGDQRTAAPRQIDLVTSVDGDSTEQQQQQSDTDGHTHRRPLTEAELLAKRKEKNRKKKTKLREKIKAQLDAAESDKQSWQSFANQRGLKGLNKRSIFASPCSVKGKVGVGTNGVADLAPTAKGGRSSGASSAPSTGATSSALITKRRY